ncbi:RNA-guided endonuclease TnpB family protein [Phocaeicola plebeius]|uniref:RNA-guided endonuclease TnpB family protein n=1 Tax=Phocaeicola plebeius TaxID=310297 RepID=UPI0021AC7C4F|nr:RNA-guided endonuclease TnpB family protein [Phocaeicola plebeius]MCR8883659.1 RNA-guided endonuclease TnpB family protein [Phocaeicola plebeius]
MPIITRKIELKIVKDGLTDEEYDQQWKYLYQINNTIYLAANRISTHCLFNDEYEMRLKLHMPRYKEIEKELKKLDSDKKTSDKEIRDRLLNERKELDEDVKNKKKDFLQCSKQNSTYQLVSKEFKQYIPSDILANLNQKIQENYNNNQKKIESGERALSTYKKGMEIPFSIRENKRLKLFIKEEGIYLKWFKEILFRLEFGKDASNNRCIVERLIESDKQQKKKGEDYVANNSSIKLVKNGRNTRIFLLLSIDIPAKKQVLDKDVVLGVDLGIKCPLYLAINKNDNFKMQIGDIEHFHNQRTMFQKRFKSLQKLMCTQGGHGRKKKLEPLEKLKEKERNWVHTQNHVYSREVIKQALKQNAGTIHMESLKDFGKGKEGYVKDEYKYLLRYWSYYELQSMIAYKAKLEGIEVKYIDPAYTSQTCSYCGERGERKKQEEFVCTNPQCKRRGEKINADFNAARNIAMSKKIVER